MALRPYWSGQIRLSLVSLPVNIYAALSRSRTIPLHEIYRPTGQRVRHQNVVDGEPVDRDDIVKGYEVEKGEYVLLDPEEIKELKIPSKRTLEITQFRKSDPYFKDIENEAIDKEQLSLAKELIKRKTATFEPEKFHDHYREALQELIDSKLEGREPREVIEEQPSGKVINLMDALRKSLKEQNATPPARKRARSNPKPKKTPARKKAKHGRAA